MTRFYILIVGLLVCLALPATSFSQVVSGADRSAGFGSLPFPFPNSSFCSGAGSSLMTTPTLYVGWVEHPTGSTWTLARQTSAGVAPWPLRGLWLGATKDLALDKSAGVILSGGGFFARRSSGTWFTSPSGSSFSFEIPSYYWWHVEGLVKYSASGPFAILAGFRWDHTSTRVDYSDNTSDDYILNAYIPLFGAQIDQQFSTGSLLVRFVGTPLVRGSIRYHFWDRLGYAELGDFPVNANSYLLEIFADYRFKLASGLGAGGFAKWNSLHVRTRNKNLSGSTTESVSWAVDIRSWTLGADVSLDF